MDNAYTHTDSAAGCDSGSTMDLKSFASGFLLAAAFFLVPMLTATEFQAQLFEQDIDGDNIPDSVDSEFRSRLYVAPVEEVICEATDANEDGVVDEGEGCEEVADVEDADADTEDATDEDAEADVEVEDEATDEDQEESETEV